MRFLMLATLLAMGFLPGVASAQTCQGSFQKAGNALTGLRFSASTSAADLTPASAIGQLRGIVLAKSYQVLVAEPDGGTMVFEQPASGNARAIQLVATATEAGGKGVVKVEAKFPRGMMATEEAAKTELCSILAQVKGGRAGEQAAAKGQKAAGKAAPALRMGTLALSNMILNDYDKNPGAIIPRYKGRAFIVNGRIDTIHRGDGGNYFVYFEKIDPMSLPITVPGQQRSAVQVLCVLAKDQASFALTHKKNDKVTLGGVFDDFDYGSTGAIWLRECRPEK